LPSEKRIEIRSSKMTVICERVGNAESAHDSERNVINDTGVTGVSATIVTPCLLDIDFNGTINKARASRQYP